MTQAFDPRERRAIEAAMIFRYAEPVALEEADVELKLDADSDALTGCPSIYWQERGTQFVVCKTAASRYRSYFFYTDDEQFRIGERDYDAIEDCLRELLQLQADHQAERAELKRRLAAIDLGDEEYTGPIVI